MGALLSLTGTNTYVSNIHYAASGQVTLAKAYTQYGEVLSSSGSGASPFAYTGEQQDASGFTYLQARVLFEWHRSLSDAGYVGRG